MEISDENILDEKFIKPKIFYQELNALSNKMPLFLDDFRNDFVNFNLNPENSEYQTAFQNDKNILNNINNDTIQLVKSIENNTIFINNVLFQLNIMIKEAKKTHRELKAKLGIINNEMSASDELISDYTEMYNYGYLRNWGLVLCIIAGGIIISKVYPGRNVNMMRN